MTMSSERHAELLAISRNLGMAPSQNPVAGPRANYVPWSEKTSSQKKELRRQWKFADDFIGRPQQIDLIRLAMMQDLSEMVSGADIWRPR